MFKFCNIYSVSPTTLVVLDMPSFTLLTAHLWYGYASRIFKNNDTKYITLLILLSPNTGFTPQSMTPSINN